MYICIQRLKYPLHAHAQSQMHMHKSKQRQNNMHTDKYAHIYLCTHAYSQLHIHAHAHMQADFHRHQEISFITSQAHLLYESKWYIELRKGNIFIPEIAEWFPWGNDSQKMFLQKSEHFKGKFPTKTFVFLTWRQVKQPPLPSLASSSYSALWVQFLAQPSLVLLRTWMVWGSPSKELPSNKSRRAILKIVVYAKGIQVFVNGHL